MNTETNSDAPAVGQQRIVLPVGQVVLGDNCEVMRQWPSESVDLVVTSPPYDDLRTYGEHEWDFYGVAWNLKRLLKPGGVIVWVVNDATKDGSETGTSMRQGLHFQTLGLNLHDTMIYQNPRMPLNGNRYEPEFEFMFVLSKGKPNTWNPIKVKAVQAGKRQIGTARQKDGTTKARHGQGAVTASTKVKGNVWHINNNPSVEDKTGHPAPFPIRLAKEHIQSWSNLGDVVVDPFVGSGTTIKAAKELGRQWVGIDVNPDYIPIAKARTAQEVLAL